MPSAIRKLLVANRSEIAIRVFRTAHELGIRTVAIYSHEDRYALHRFKADEAYQIGQPGEPIRAYLDIEAIVECARQARGRCHPSGLRFPVREPGLARACRRPGSFSAARRRRFWKSWATRSRPAASPWLPEFRCWPAAPSRLTTAAKRRASWPRSWAIPCCSKRPRAAAAAGCVSSTSRKNSAALEQAQRESQAAFGSADVFLEKYIAAPRHIEVQLLGDKHGNLVHLHERDCSIQRRASKSGRDRPGAESRGRIARKRSATRRYAIGQAVKYENAGTVEFLLDADTGSTISSKSIRASRSSTR